MVFFKQKGFFLLFLSLAVFFPARARGPEHWIQITNQNQLKKEIKKEEREKRLELTCFLQLKKKQLPYSCYPWLKSVSFKKKNQQEKDATFEVGGPHSRKKKKHTNPINIQGLFGSKASPSLRSPEVFLNYLNEKCQKLAPHLKDLKKINDILKIPELSPFCRKLIEKQQKIREYQLRDETTEKLLEWHYPALNKLTPNKESSI